MPKEVPPKISYVAQMAGVVEQIRLLDDQVAEKDEAVRDARQSAEWKYQTCEASDLMTEIEMLAAENSREPHSALIDTFKVVTDLHKKPKEALNGPTPKKAIR